MWKYIVGNILLFAGYVQWSPNMGNIWIRKDENNKNKLQLHNLFRLMAAPIKEKTYWYPSQWDINVFTFVSILLFLETTLESYIEKRYS